MSFTKLMLEKKFRQEKSVRSSISSSLFPFLDRKELREAVWRGGIIMLSSGLCDCALLESRK